MIGPRNTLTLRTGLLMLAVALASGGLCTALFLRESRASEQRQREREVIRTGMYNRYFRVELVPVVNDLRALVTGDGFSAYLETGSAADLDRAVRRAVFYSNLHPAYDKVRFIDENGREHFRVNRGGQVVAAERLQDKSTRSFYQDAAQLKPGQIYISAFDLNVENDAVEQPIKPTIRCAMPVFDHSGRRRGIYIINFLGDELLTRLLKSIPAFSSRLRILNANGYWIRAAKPEMAWGFVLADRAGYSLAREDPALWSEIVAAPQGQVDHGGGVFTWEHVNPRDIEGVPANTVVSGDSFLVIASEVTADEWAVLTEGVRQTFFIVTPVVVLLAAGAVWLSAARKRALIRFQRSEESLSITLNSIADAVLATDRHGCITLINPVACALTGWSESEAMGRPAGEVLSLVDEVSGVAVAPPVDEVRLTGQTLSIANHRILIDRAGGRRSIADSAAPIRDRGGALAGVVVVFRDVTQVRRAQAELDRFFQLSLDFLCIASMDGYFKRVSPAVTDVLGWSVPEFLALPYMELIHPDDRPSAEEEVARQAAGEKVMHYECRFRHKDGSYRVLAWRSVPQADGLMFATARDVTERNLNEDRINRLNTVLQEHSSQLESANKELEAFSYSVSHDLRAPLRHIQGYVEMLTRELGESLTEKSRRYLRTISQSAHEMGVLIDDLLSFSRMGRAEMSETNVDTNTLVAEVRRGLEASARGRKIEWRVETLPRIRGDAAMLRQVWVNLLSNALKYSRHRDPAVIELGTAGKEGDFTVFFVRDNGAGFDMKYVDKLFGVFQRLHRSDEFEGTGIGLANVRRIVARHGGRTWAEGRVNEGATFYFTLRTASADSLTRPPFATRPPMP